MCRQRGKGLARSYSGAEFDSDALRLVSVKASDLESMTMAECLGGHAAVLAHT